MEQFSFVIEENQLRVVRTVVEDLGLSYRRRVNDKYLHRIGSDAVDPIRSEM